MSRTYVLGTLVIAAFGIGYPCTASAAGKVTDLTINFHTNDDDREGGVVEVTVWQDDRLIAKYEDSEKSWGKGEDVKVSADNPLKERAYKDGLPIEVRVKLREAKEVNISWTFNIEVSLFNDQGKKMVIGKTGMKLDTTGKGPNRESEAVVGTSSEWK